VLNKEFHDLYSSTTIINVHTKEDEAHIRENGHAYWVQTIKHEGTRLL
jgi:hypothetical protein